MSQEQCLGSVNPAIVVRRAMYTGFSEARARISCRKAFCPLRNGSFSQAGRIIDYIIEGAESKARLALEQCPNRNQALR